MPENMIHCPAALNIAGRHYPCRQMEQMAAGSKNHDGWAHSNPDAQAIWVSHRDPVPGMPAWADFERDVLEPIRRGDGRLYKARVAPVPVTEAEGES